MSQPIENRVTAQVNEAWGTTRTPLGHKAVVLSLDDDICSPDLQPHNPEDTTKDERFSTTADIIKSLWNPFYGDVDYAVGENEVGDISLNINSQGNSAETILTKLDPFDTTTSVIDANYEIRSAINELSVAGILTQMPTEIQDDCLKNWNKGNYSYEISNYIADIAGGSNEGQVYIGLALAALLENQPLGQLPTGEKIEKFMKNTYRTILGMTEFNFTPMKLLDYLAARHKNPFKVICDDSGERAELKDEYATYLKGVGHQVMGNSDLMSLPEHDIRIFKAINNLLPECFFGDNREAAEDIGEFVFSAIERTIRKMNLESVDSLTLLSKFEHLLFDASITTADGEPLDPELEDRLKYVVRTMGQIAAVKKFTSESNTYGCPARDAGLMDKWYKVNSGMLVDWYKANT